MQEQDNFKNQFCMAANSLTKLYMTGLENQKKVYNKGVQETIEKINNFLQFKNEKRGTIAGYISVDELQSFMMTLVQDGDLQKDSNTNQNTLQKEHTWNEGNTMPFSLNEFHFDTSVQNNSGPFQRQENIQTPTFTFKKEEPQQQVPFFQNNSFTFDVKQTSFGNDFVLKNDETKKRVTENHNEFNPVKRTKN